jgi:hypothetical protein
MMCSGLGLGASDAASHQNHRPTYPKPFRAMQKSLFARQPPWNDP